MADLNAFARTLADADAAAPFDIRLNRLRDRVSRLSSWDAVIEFALAAQALSKGWADELRALEWDKNFAKFVHPKDDRAHSAAELRFIPVGAFIAFVSVDEPSPYFSFVLGKKLGRRHLVHAMISLGRGFAAGVGNKRGIGIGNDGQWEVLDLASLCVWTGASVAGVPLGTRQARPLHVRFRRLEAFQVSPRDATSVSIENLTPELMKRVAIQPMQGGGRLQNSPEWSVVDPPGTEALVLFQDDGRAGFGGGAWNLTNADFGWSTPCYFLPWSSKRIVKLKLGNQHAVFATAAINGCSVFTRGNPASPTVYHAGIDGTLDKDAFVVDALNAGRVELDAGLSALFTGPRYARARASLIAAAQAQKPDFWRLLVRRLVPGIGQDPGWSEVNKLMYGKTSVRGLAVRDKVLAAHAAAFTDADGYLRGSYIGFAHNGQWALYFQENLSINYKRKGTAEAYSASFPIALTQVYPPGNGGVNLITPVPDRIVAPFTPSDTVVRTA